MKGLHLTIDGWRPGCDPDTGWKTPRKRSILEQDEDGDWYEVEQVDEPAVEPECVPPSTRLQRDLEFLEELLEGDEPVSELVRAGKTSVATSWGTRAVRASARVCSTATG